MAEHQHSVASIYATALYECAVEAGNLDRIEQELSEIRELLRQEPLVLRFASNPTIPIASKRKVFERVFGERRTVMIRNFFTLLAEKGRVTLFDQIVEVFREICNRKAGIMEFELRSAAKFEPQETARLVQVLEKRYARKVIINETVDPKIIGGFLLRNEDRQYDLSFKSQLRRLSERMESLKSNQLAVIE